jgi:hypothetical protein
VLAAEQIKRRPAVRCRLRTPAIKEPARVVYRLPPAACLGDVPRALSLKQAKAECEARRNSAVVLGNRGPLVCLTNSIVVCVNSAICADSILGGPLAPGFRRYRHYWHKGWNGWS